MARRIGSIRIALLSGSMLVVAPALAADVTPERLLNPDKEPQNWLMNHRTYDGQRFSPLDKINKGNVKGLKLAYAVALGGGAGNEFTNATPLVEDGFLYVTDSWNVLYKIDVRSGDAGRILWRMDPKQDRQMRSRGAALWGNLVITGAGGFGNAPRIIATDKESGKVVWESSFQDTPDVTFTAAPLAIKDKIIVGAANGDTGVRDWIAGLDAATGKRLWRQFIVPAPGEPGSETWKGNNNANWTKGIDQKTGKPLEYDPTKDIQIYAGVGNLTPGAPLKKVCPSIAGGNNYWPSSYSPKTKLLYIPAMTACMEVAVDREKHNKQKGWNGGSYTTDERIESNLTAVDPTTGEIRKNVHLRYPNYSGTLATSGELVFLALLDGTVAAFDDTSLDEIWKINMGSGFSAPPMTFETGGKQYIAIVSGPSPSAKSRRVNTPELNEQRNALVLYVFGL